MSTPHELYLPDPLEQWHWQRTMNPYYAEIKPESDTWVREFEAIDSKSQSAFDLCNFGEPWTYLLSSRQLTGHYIALLCGLGYSLLDKGLY